MFGIFNKRNSGTSEDNIYQTVKNISAVYESLNDSVEGLYREFDGYNPLELRFFTMSAVSVLVQAIGGLPEREMQSVIGKFTEQSIGMMLFYMPKVEYSQVHNAFANRFPAYPDLIMGVFNSQTANDLQRSTSSLVMTMDRFIRVERGAFDVSLAGLEISTILTDLVASVRKAVTPG